MCGDRRRRGREFETDGIYKIRIDPTDHDRWQVRGWWVGFRSSTRCSVTCHEESEAVNAARDLWSLYLAGGLETPERAPTTVGELVDRFLERTHTRRGRSLSPRTIRSYKSHLRALLEVTGPDKPVTHVSVHHIRQAVDTPTSPASRATYLRSIRALWRWALKRLYVDVDITRTLVVDPGPPQIRPYFQPEEVAVFLEHCAPSIKIRASLICETGLRAGEAVSLRWAWVTRGVGRPSIRIPAYDPVSGFRAKSARSRAIPLSRRAQQVLGDAARMWGELGYVLHDRDKPIQHSNWHRDVKAACKAAKLHHVDTHGLRRTFGVKMLAAGVDIYQLSKLLGHASVTTTERAYAGIADSAWSRVMDLVDEAAEVTRLPWRAAEDGER